MFKTDRKFWSRTACAVAALLWVAPAAAAQQARALVLEGGVLIDGTGRAPVPDAVVVVQGDRITAVGRRGQVRIPANARVIKLEGRTILPGLIDSHVHTEEFHLPMFLHYGVTTIQDKNNDPGWILAERDGLKSGAIKGPRMFASGEVHTGNNFNTPPAMTPEETRISARSALAAGFDSFNTNQRLPYDQLRVLIEVADQAGVSVMGHTRNIRKAAELGYKYEEHMFTMGAAALDPEDKTTIGLDTDNPESLADPGKFPPLVKYMVDHGVFVNPTLAAQWAGETPRGAQMAKDLAQLASDPDLAFVPAGVRAQWARGVVRRRDGYANVAEFIRQYAAAGGKLTVGTDSSTNTVPGLSLYYEMQMLVDAGVSPMQAIQGATLWGAQLIRQDKDVGSVEPGKLADFTIIEGDPLADISAVRNVRTVIKSGQVIDTAYDPKWVNPIPGRGDPPAIAKVTPAVARRGGQTVTLEIEAPANGQRAPYTPSSIVRFDTVDLPTRFVSSTKLSATLDAKLLDRSPGLYLLYVLTPGLHGSVSPAAYEVIDTTDAPVRAAPIAYTAYAGAAPRLFGPTPRAAPQGGGTVTLDIGGTRFTPDSVVRFDNVDLPTSFVSSTKLTATVDAKLLQRSVGAYPLYVVNPGPYGIISEPGSFLVAPPR